MFADMTFLIGIHCYARLICTLKKPYYAVLVFMLPSYLQPFAWELGYSYLCQ